MAPKNSCNLTFQVSGGESSISSPSQLELVKRNNLAQDTVIPIDIKSSQDNSIKTNFSADSQMLAVKAIDILNDGKNPLNISTMITGDANNAEEFQIWDGKTAVKWCSQGTCPNACPITIENNKGSLNNLTSEKSCKLYIYSPGSPEKSLDASLNITATNTNKYYKATDIYSLHAVQNLYATGYINTASDANLSLYKAALPELQSFQVISSDAPKLQTPSYGLSASPNGQVLIANGQNLYQYDFVHQRIVKLPDLTMSDDGGYISAIAATNSGIYIGTKNKIYLYQFNHFGDIASLVSEITETKSQPSETNQNDISGIALSYKENNPDQVYYVDTGSITIHKSDSALSQVPSVFANYVVAGASYPTYSLIYNQPKIGGQPEDGKFFIGFKLPTYNTLGSYNGNTQKFSSLTDEKGGDISIDPAHSDAYPLALAQTVGGDGTPLNTYVTTSKSNKVFVYGNQNAHYLQETNLSYPNTVDNKEVTAMRLAVGAELSVSRMLEHRL